MDSEKSEIWYLDRVKKVNKNKTDAKENFKLRFPHRAKSKS